MRKRLPLFGKSGTSVFGCGISHLVGRAKLLLSRRGSGKYLGVSRLGRSLALPRTTMILLLVCCFVLTAGCRRQENSPTDSSETPSPVVPETVTTKSGSVMVRIPPGEFTMGDEAGNDDEKPAHKVFVAGFLMDVCEVTQESYQQMTGKNPSKSKGPDKPVEQVSWYRAAVLYCNMRSAREELQPCYDMQTGKCDFKASGYRLPTEAEWEYACRAGKSTKSGFDTDERLLSKYAWFKGNSGKTTHPVGTKRPNDWGLYDMQGNVMEWCHDRYAEDYYGKSPSDNPTGPASGDECVLRGGSWSRSAESCRAASRYSETPQFADACFGSDNYGFRCVRRLPDSTPASSGP